MEEDLYEVLRLFNLFHLVVKYVVSSSGEESNHGNLLHNLEYGRIDIFIATLISFLEKFKDHMLAYIVN